MTKFLRIVENNLPSEQEGELGKMTDKLAELLNTIGSVEVASTAPASELTVNIAGHTIVLEIKDVHSKNTEEDAEDPKIGVAMNAQYNIDAKITDMANRATKGTTFGFGGAAAQAKTAVAKRDAVVKRAIPIYNQVTDELNKALKNADPSIITSISQ